MVNKKETTLRDILEKLEENKKILTDILRWVRFQNIGKLKDVLIAELDTDGKKLAFDNTDGVRGLDEVAKASGTPRDTVYGWWKKWANLGILEPSDTRKGRLKKLCSLEDVGMKVPKTVGAKEMAKPASDIKTETPPEVIKT
jgi:hypothetical protein